MSDVLFKIVNMSVSASIIVLAVLLLRLAFKKAPKWITVLLWAIVAIRLVCPFTFESPISLMPSGKEIDKQLLFVTETQIVKQTNHVTNQNEISQNGQNITSEQPPNDKTPTKTPNSSTADDTVTIPVLDIVWLGGMVTITVYALVSYINLHKKVKMAVLLRDNIYQCDAVSSPFVLGFIRPKIYMPFNIDTRSAEHVIAHEKAHISRLDYILKPMGFLILALHWFNPLVWISYVLFCKDIELACDERVIRGLSAEQRADYSQALLNLSVNRFTVAACPIAFGEVGVKSRIKGVLKYKKPAAWIVAAAVVAIAATSACMLTDPIAKAITDNANKKTQAEKFEDTPQNPRLLSVLNNDAPFISVDGKSVYLSAYKPIVKEDTYSWNMDTVFLPEEYTFVDLDQDGSVELVAYDNSNIDNLYLILKEQGGQIYGYSLYSKMQFKADGTFRTYHGSYVQQYKTISFNKTDFTQNIFAEYTVYENGYIDRINLSTIDGKEVSYEKITEFVTEWEMRPDVIWKSYTAPQSQPSEDKNTLLYALIGADDINQISGFEIIHKYGGITTDITDNNDLLFLHQYIYSHEFPQDEIHKLFNFPETQMIKIMQNSKDPQTVYLMQDGSIAVKAMGGSENSYDVYIASSEYALNEAALIKLIKKYGGYTID